MLPTPSTSHINPDRIYEPAEDSFLLLDTISSSSEAAFLSQRFHHPFPPPLVLEVGPGSGVVLAFLTANAEAIFGRADIVTLGIDANEYACEATKETVSKACEGKESGVFLGAVHGDLALTMRKKAVDVLLFNPPYVPTEALSNLNLAYCQRPAVDRLDEDAYLLELSFAGGEDGMEVTNRLLEQLPDVLSEAGVAYILLCQSNKPGEVKNKIDDWGEVWAVDTVGRSGKMAGWEKLQVIRIWRK